MSGNHGKKPGGGGRKIYRNLNKSGGSASNSDHSLKDNDVQKDEDTLMTDNVTEVEKSTHIETPSQADKLPEVQKPATTRVLRAPTKRKLLADPDASKVQPQPRNKRQKTAKPDSSVPDQSKTQTSTQPSTQSVDVTLSQDGESKVKFKTVADFVRNYQPPTKRVMKILPTLQWDAKANRPLAMTRIGYGNSKDEEAQAYRKQTTMPLRGDRLIRQSTQPASGNAPGSPAQTDPSDLSRTLSEEICELLRELHQKLPPI